MISDLASSLKASIYERVYSPLLGTFLISWMTFNWKVVAIFFLSKTEIEQRIVAIENFTDFQHCIVYPLITTLLFVFVYPLATWPVAYVHERMQAARARLRYNFSLKVPLDWQEALELRQEMTKIQEEAANTSSSLRGRLEAAEAEVKRLEDELSQSQENNQMLQECIDRLNAPQTLSSGGAYIERYQDHIDSVLATKQAGEVLEVEQLIGQENWAQVPRTMRPQIISTFAQWAGEIYPEIEAHQPLNGPTTFLRTEEKHVPHSRPKLPDQAA